jgi:hypothetical protein
MATVTIVDKFPKATYTPDDVASERALRLSISSVVSCNMTDDADNWILTTVYNAGAVAPGAPTAPSPGTPILQPGTNTQFGSLVPGGFFSSAPFDHSVPRSIRTNNAGALNISSWQRTRPGFVGVTEPDGSSNHNVTTIYRTPEHGVGSWFHLIKGIYGFGAAGNFTIDQLAQRYAGSATGPSVTGYHAGWSHFSGGTMVAATVISLASNTDMLALAKAMFGHEAGIATPLHDDQITYAVAHERAGTLPA